MKYYLQIKTKDAELRALKNLPKDFFTKKEFSLVVNITRGRKSKKDPDGNIQRRIDSLSEFVDANLLIFLDLTSDDSLVNEQINELYSCESGYYKWRIFVREQTKTFFNAVPFLLYNDMDEDYSDVYTEVAKKVTISPYFYKEPDSWGLQTIVLASKGYKPGATPSFWISVRMNIFVTLQLCRLKIIT